MQHACSACLIGMREGLPHLQRRQKVAGSDVTLGILGVLGRSGLLANLRQLCSLIPFPLLPPLHMLFYLLLGARPASTMLQLSMLASTCCKFGLVHIWHVICARRCFGTHQP